MKAIYQRFLVNFALVFLLFALSYSSVLAEKESHIYSVSGENIDRFEKPDFVFPSFTLLLAMNQKFAKGSLVDFSSAQFGNDSGIGFSEVVFGEKSSVLFDGCRFAESAKIYFDKARFGAGTIVQFGSAEFGPRSIVTFSGSEFGEGSYFDFTDVKSPEGCRIIFDNARFAGSVSFEKAVFDVEPQFRNAYFNGSVNVSGTHFNRGVELRLVDFTKVKIYYNDRTFFPSGKLMVNWSQLKGHLYLDDRECQLKDDVEKFKKQKELTISGRDSLAVYEKQFNRERYDLTEIFYYRLRDNFLAQNDKASADGVMFELAEKRAEFLTEPLWILYGWTMGWGYKPVRFLVTVFCVIVLPFAWFWYRRYYHLILPQFDHSEDDALLKYQSGAKRDKLDKNFDHTSIHGDEISYLARLWHVLFFSTSVLLGLRFKKEWIEKRDHTFLRWVTFEWLLGIGLYVLFAVLVKSYEFSYIKGLIGF